MTRREAIAHSEATQSIGARLVGQLVTWHTDRETVKILGISRSRVHQIERIALWKIYLRFHEEAK